MDITRSQKIVKDYLQQKNKQRRRLQEFSWTSEATPDQLFPLLCPAREADWIPGWDCKMIYSKTGFAEDKCVFSTDKSNPTGEGIWVFTGYKKDKLIEFLRFQRDLILYVRITLKDNKDGTTTINWETTATALTEEGNRLLNKMPFEKNMSKVLTEMIEHYLKKGTSIGKFPILTGMIHHLH